MAEPDFDRRAVRLAMKCAQLSKELRVARESVERLTMRLRASMEALEQAGVALELEEAAHADHEERRA